MPRARARARRRLRRQTSTAPTLAKLWEFNTNAGVNAPPMTFAVDGKQYVAILVGLGGAWDKWFIEFDQGPREGAPELDALRLQSLTC